VGYPTDSITLRSEVQSQSNVSKALSRLSCVRGKWQQCMGKRTDVPFCKQVDRHFDDLLMSDLPLACRAMREAMLKEGITPTSRKRLFRPCVGIFHQSPNHSAR